MPRRLATASVCVILLVGACGSGDGAIGADDPNDAQDAVRSDETVTDRAPEPPPASQAPGRWRPGPDSNWHWQLTGDLDTDVDADVFDIDLFDTPSATIAGLQTRGRRVICYFSAGSVESWRDDADRFPAEAVGEPLDGWEGEHWLDIRAPEVLALQVARLDLAREKGCDGAEPDNVQAHLADTGFDLTASDQVVYNRALADAAHVRDLAIGLKNAADLIPELVDHFEFSINEQCHEFDECEPYEAFVAAGKPVFNAEYAVDYVEDEDARAELCRRSRASGFRTLVLPIDLDGSYRFSCDQDGS